MEASLQAMRLSPIQASGGKRHSHLRGGMQRSASGPSLREQKLDQTYADTCQAFLENFRRGMVATVSGHGTDLQANRTQLARGKSSLVAPMALRGTIRVLAHFQKSRNASRLLAGRAPTQSDRAHSCRPTLRVN